MACFHSFSLQAFDLLELRPGITCPAKTLRLGKSRGGCSASYLLGKALQSVEPNFIVQRT